MAKWAGKKKRAFLDAFAVTPVIRQAAWEADVSQAAHRLWLLKDEVYRREFEHLKAAAATKAEKESALPPPEKPAGRPVASERKKALLDAFALTLMLGQAAKSANVNPSTHRYWLQKDPKYKADFEALSERAILTMEDEARRRAVEGVEEPIMFQGEMVRTVRKFSDVLLIFLLKAARPEMYRDNPPPGASQPLAIDLELRLIAGRERAARFKASLPPRLAALAQKRLSAVARAPQRVIDVESSPPDEPAPTQA